MKSLSQKTKNLTGKWIQRIDWYIIKKFLGTYFFAIALMARALFHIYKKKICELNFY